MILNYDNIDHIYTGPAVTLVLNGKTFTPAENLMPPVIIEDRTLVPAREVFEALGGTVTWNATDRSVIVDLSKNKIILKIDNKKAVVNDKEIDLDVPAKLVNAKTMVPVRFISENCGLTVTWDSNTNTVNVSSKEEAPLNNILNINTEMIDGVNCIKVKASNEIDKYNCFNLTEPNRIILDIYNSKFGFEYKTIELQNNNIQKIRFGVQENNVNRVVIDVLELKQYEIKLSADKKELVIAFGKIQEEPTVPSEPSDEENEATPPETSAEKSSVTSIKYSPTAKATTIKFDKKVKYNVTTLTNPDRIIFDFENSILALDIPNNLEPKDTVIESIRFSQKDESTVRVVFDLKYYQAKYDVNEKDNAIEIKFTKPGYKNVSYSNSGTYPKITLLNVDLDNLSLVQSKSNNKYTISFSSSKFKPGSGTIEIGDEYIDNIVISSTKISVYDKGNVKYYARQSGSNVVITIKDGNSTNNKVIVIDPGHGGKDPGAVNGTNYEKDFNLDIAKKLYELLAETEGVDVYLTRDDDTYLDKYQRAAVATDVNADLFISVHNNSLDNKAYDGTMVLYAVKESDKNFGITSKEFATIVHDELIDTLGTTDRKIVNREDLYVLSQTEIPAILCEVVFVSNDSDLAKLKKESFREDAAEAMYRGIQKVLEEI
jgi:N-acetylmuramoyl-L-alanine amidase